jgi:hypothetical protein
MESNKGSLNEEVFVKFRTRLPLLQMEAPPLSLPLELNRVGLSKIVAHLLGFSEEDEDGNNEEEDTAMNKEQHDDDNKRKIKGWCG